ncbi:MAG: amidohydrolase [Firmicutes bacterium]|nr:amidohydrolase [Bacillota bacterium]
MIKQKIYDEVQGLEALLQNVSRHIWSNPELSGQEIESAIYYRELMTNEGFKIINSKTLSTAFYAEYGSGNPVIAVLGEYDALPGLSQEVGTSQKCIVKGGPGHGCGHNLLGSAAAIAAIAIKRYIEQYNVPGTVRFYGCPEEELLMGKVKMIAEGLFEGCNAALSWHPMDANMAHDAAYLANTSMKFFFTGKSSHAAFAPERGRSALDAVEIMNVGVNYLREHVVDKTRIHYTTDSGGFAPNIVPDKASSWYYVRAPHIGDVMDAARRVKLCAQGATIMTETNFTVEDGFGCCEFKENNAFADLSYANLIEADAPKYTEEELEFAKALQESVDPGIVSRSQSLYEQSEASMFMGVGERNLWTKAFMNASSDTGDVSYIIPTGLFTTACWPIGCSPHTWQASSSAGATIGEKGALYAAKVIAGTAYDLLTKPKVLHKIQMEFSIRDEGTYEPLLADNYKKN